MLYQMTRLNVKPEYLTMLLDILKNYCPQAEIWAYGSRVNGGSHDGSDLDLTVKDFGSENVNLAKLKTLISESNIPFLVDINEYDKLPESFRNEIMNNYVKIFPD